MNTLRIRKKHSRRIADLAFRKGFLDKETYDILYMSEGWEPISVSGRQGKMRRRDHRELYFDEWGYSGECDAVSLVEHIHQVMYWHLNKFDDFGNEIRPVRCFPSTWSMIKQLSRLPNREAK